MRAEVVLTVAESKRLIARGVAALPCVKAAMENGIVAVAKGTTNGYVVEELTGAPLDKKHYVTGRTVPRKASQGEKIDASLPDFVFRAGKPVHGATATGIVAEMGPGDVFIKGANALNYERQQAAVLIGHPQGGTVAGAIGHVYGRRVQLVIPVGLEKSIPGDLHDVSRWTLSGADDEGKTPRLWALDGQIVTEIEALATLTGVRAFPVGSGGIAGAEGAVWLALDGDADQVKAAVDLVDSIAGEPPFIP